VVRLLLPVPTVRLVELVPLALTLALLANKSAYMPPTAALMELFSAFWLFACVMNVGHAAMVASALDANVAISLRDGAVGMSSMVTVM
jgi:uncharacterized membrane protein